MSETIEEPKVAPEAVKVGGGWAVGVVTSIVVIVMAVGWVTGTFDNFLWHVGLNYTDCARNGFGATFCGDELKQYEQRLRDAGVEVNP